jgi:hypothetical protein
MTTDLSDEHGVDVPGALPNVLPRLSTNWSILPPSNACCSSL